MVGHFSTPITPESGSFLHADSQVARRGQMLGGAATADATADDQDVEVRPVELAEGRPRA